MRNYATEFEALMDMTLELLATLDSDSEWGVVEEDKLKRLTKIAGLIDKVKKIIGTPQGQATNPDEDEQIIQRFLACVNPLNPQANE